MSQDVFITGVGKFLPGSPISNEEMEDYLGALGERGSRIKTRVLRDNGIKTRHYAIDKNQKTLHQNSEMAAYAVQDAIERSGVNLSDMQYLAVATSQGDLPLPGFASMVHGHLKNFHGELASYQSICSSGLMAIKGAYLQVRSQEAKGAIACAAEMPSRLFKASRFKSQQYFQDSGRLPYEAEFLRWMLSDGAGACLFQNQPSSRGLSLKVDWVDLRSFANRYDVCMYVGGQKNDEGQITQSWLDMPDYQEAANHGFINLKQDIRMLMDVVKTGVDVYFDLANQNKFNTAEIDYFLFHYSSDIFRGPMIDLLKRGGALIPEEKFFTNLYTKGNTGSASIYIMLEELFNSGKLKAGQKILCMVPESGRFIIGFMLLTVVDASQGLATSSQEQSKQSAQNIPEPEAPKLELKGGAPQQRLVRELTRVWLDFERQLNQVPIIDKINRNTLRIEDYRLLLKNMRAQVVEGSRWITRAASNLQDERLLGLRSLFIHHAKDEHRDYTMLEKNYVLCGGREEDIQTAKKNIGSEALSAWMFQRASRENPIDLLGAMFIIEGLGNRMAHRWGSAIRDQLKLSDEHVSFMVYHGQNDESHFDRLEEALSSDLLTEAAVDAIVNTAKVTARLYRLQLEEIC